MKMAKMLIIAVITVFYAVRGMAGAVNEVPVIVDLELRSAQGAQTTARFADNENELIGCSATVLSDGISQVLRVGFCQATDADGVNIVCFTQDPDLLDAFNSVANYGFIRFGWNETGECVSVKNSTQSFYIPDFEKKSKK